MTHDWQTQDLECQRRFSRNLRAARERARLTQADVAEAMDMTVTVYARYERGKIWPSIGALRRLCDVLECSADLLLGLQEPEGDPASPEPPAEPLPVRRLRRQLRRADPATLRLVEQMLDKLQESGVLPEPDDDVPDSSSAGEEAPADRPGEEAPAGDRQDSGQPDDDIPGDR
jgi:transcriptional regulator with XRE-family HTH domain